MSVEPPEANGTSVLKRASEIVDNFGSTDRVLHIPLSSTKQIENAVWVGSSLFMT